MLGIVKKLQEGDNTRYRCEQGAQCTRSTCEEDMMQQRQSWLRLCFSGRRGGWTGRIVTYPGQRAMALWHWARTRIHFSHTCALNKQSTKKHESIECAYICIALFRPSISKAQAYWQTTTAAHQVDRLPPAPHSPQLGQFWATGVPSQDTAVLEALDEV